MAESDPARQAPSAKAFLEIAGRLAQQVSIVNEMTRSVRHVPEEVKMEDGKVEIRWNDGHLGRYPFRPLRQACPCALCVDEWSGEKRGDPNRVLMSVRPMDIRRVGRYALQFSWSDLHGSGIYTYDLLRSLDPTAPADPAPAPSENKSRLSGILR